MFKNNQRLRPFQILAGIALIAGSIFAGAARAHGTDATASDNSVLADTNSQVVGHGANSDVVGIGTTTGSNGSTNTNDTTDSKTSMAGMSASRNGSAPSRTTGDGTSTGMSSSGSALRGR